MLRPISVLVAFSMLVGPASAADWTVAPATNQFGAGREDFRYTINPGGSVDDGVVVENPGTTPQRVPIDAVGTWVIASQGEVTVGPGESVEVPFSVSLPADAKPGDRVGAIAGVPVRLRVGGALMPSLAVENVRLSGEVVTYTIHNTGNAILSARQSVSVSGPFGLFKGRAGKLAAADSLLPGERRKVSARVSDLRPAVRLTATVTLHPLLTDAAGSIAPLAEVKATGHGWAIPWTLLVGIVLVAAVAIATTRARRRRTHA